MKNFATVAAVAVLGFAVAASPFLAAAHNDSAAKVASQNGTSVAVVITEPGNVLVRGAKVLTNTNGVVTAQTSWAGSSMTWTVTTDATTKFYTRAGNTAQLSQVAVGDTVSFAGTFVTGMTVKATALKDWNLEAVAAPTPVTDKDKRWDKAVKSWFSGRSFFNFNFHK